MYIYIQHIYTDLKGSLAGEALEDDGAEGPEVCLPVVLQRHDHFRGLNKVIDQIRFFQY